MMAVYLLHFDKNLGGKGRASARHYLGWVNGNRGDVRRRVLEHLNGVSRPKIIQAFWQIGAHGTLVHLWPGGDRALERRLKRNGRYSDYCRLCKTNHSATGVRAAKNGRIVWPKNTSTR